MTASASLLSETTSVPCDHTRLAAVLEDAPTVDTFGFTTEIASRMLDFERSPLFDQRIKEKVGSFATSFVAATVEVANELEEDDVAEDTSPVIQHFYDLDMRLAFPEHRAIDAGLRMILRESDIARLFTVDREPLPTEIYLFKIATSDANNDLVVEMSRTHMHTKASKESPIEPIVRWSLNFSGYEHSGD